MPSRFLSIQRAAYKVAYAAITALLTSIVFLIFIIKPGVNGYERAMFKDMVYGKAYKPFVYRTLLPGTVRLITSALPADIRTSISQSDLNIPNWEQEFLTEYLVASILMCASLVGFGLAIRYLFNGIFHAPARFVDLVSLAAIACLPFFFKYYSYIYDFPTLFLFTLGLGLMVRCKWPQFLILFLIACLNKETAILLTLMFAIYFWGRRDLVNRMLFTRLLFCQLGIFLLIRMGIVWNFRNNPGSSLEFHLFDHNFMLLLQPYSLSALFVVLGLTLLIFYKWSEKPLFLKRGLWMLVPLVAAALFFGYIDELRDYYEVYPILLLLIAHSVGNIVGLEIVTTIPSVRTLPSFSLLKGMDLPKVVPADK